MLFMDDAEGMRVQTLDLVRRLTATELDVDDACSILLGTERLLATLVSRRAFDVCTRRTGGRQMRA